MPLHVAFLWHMHQPHYVDSVRGVALMPWVRLHATKGYLDMLWMVEQHPEFRCTFNLTPVLLQQIQQLSRREVRDLWRELAQTPANNLTGAQRRDLLEHFFKANWPNMVKPFPRYWALLQKRGTQIAPGSLDRIAGEFSVQEFRDLQVWHNLTWFGYAAHRLYPEIADLKRKGANFTEADKQLVFERQDDVLREIIGWYKQAADRGQIEISTTPFYHPILPLVYNTEFARRCLPGKELPAPFSHPEDVRTQLASARDYHRQLFGQPPVGVWPSEGSVCPELIPVLQELGFEWFATDEAVLWRSLTTADPGIHHERHATLYQGFRAEFGSARMGMAFRDREISDFIGFSAAGNTPQNAAKFVAEKLAQIWRVTNRHVGDPLCAVILDGENAWENFADGGEAFLQELYTTLSRHHELKPVTLRDHFRQHPPKPSLQTLHTGSWINADFKIWIGHPEDNTGWERLAQTRSHWASKTGISNELRERALAEIHAAEGSDWFWWYGDDFVTDNDQLFDELFRTHLQNVYRLLGDKVPENLKQPICQLAPVIELREPTELLEVTVDGRATSYYEWLGAGVYEAGRGMGTMFQAERVVDTIRFGSDLRRFYFRVDFRQQVALPDPGFIRMTFAGPQHLAITFPLVHARMIPGQVANYLSGGKQQQPVRVVTAAFDEVFEVAIPHEALGLRSREKASFFIEVLKGEVELERHPSTAAMSILVPDDQFEIENWSV